MQTLAHEVLHTCPGCRNHGALWKEYAARMNGAYGYAISRTGTCEALGVADVRPVRYRLVCERCGQEFCRSRRPRWWITRSGTAAGGWRAAPQQLNLSGEGVPNGKEKIRRPCSIVFSPSPACPSAARFWRGSSCMWPVLWMRALLASIQPLWLLGAALCVPPQRKRGRADLYGMGRSAGCPVKLAGCFDAAYIGEFLQAGPRRRAGAAQADVRCGHERHLHRLHLHLEGSGQHHGLHRLCSGRPGL